MHPASSDTPKPTTERSRRPLGFTLLELLIVIGIITILSVFTVMSVGSISRDVKVATGVNRVTNALATARAEAIRTNTPVLVSFRMVKDIRRPGKKAQVEIALASWTGEFYPPEVTGYGGPLWSERYLPISEIPPQLLPEGIRVAGSFSDFDLVSNAEQSWCFMNPGDYTQPIPVPDIDGDGFADYFTSDAPGQMIGVLFGPDGGLLTRNNASVSVGGLRNGKWIDFNGDGRMEIGTTLSGNPNNAFYYQNDTDDEPFMNMSQYLVVFDGDRANEEVEIPVWTGNTTGYFVDLDRSLGTWVNEHADRIHFNRYTGLAEVGDS